MSPNWIIVTIANFFVASILGVILRYAFVGELTGWSFRHVMHAHSHLSMIGWVFMILFIIIMYRFLPGNKRSKPIYSWMFWFNQVIVVIMTISFILHGYGTISIALLIFHLFISYLFTYCILRDTKGITSQSLLVLRTAFAWLILSTFALWALGPVIHYYGKNSELYFWSIQFFLHFQFNGWFIFSVLAIFFNELERKQIKISPSGFKVFYLLLVISCFMTYSLAVTWSRPQDFLFITNSLGVVLQLIALLYLVRILWSHKIMSFLYKDTLSKTLFNMAGFSLVLKIIIQAVVVIPGVAVISYTIRQFVIGFIHLTLMGIVTGYIFAFLTDKNYINTSKISAKAGLVLFLAGFAATESLLFMQGLMLWMEKGFIHGYFEWIFILSIILPLSLMLILISMRKQVKEGLVFDH